jgi:hypothetical protein
MERLEPILRPHIEPPLQGRHRTPSLYRIAKEEVLDWARSEERTPPRHFLKSRSVDPIPPFADTLAMKPLDLPLDQMTTREKLRAIETIWENLARNERQVKSPDWHFDEMKAREQRRKTGKEKVLDWDAAKKELRRRHS